MSDESDSDDPRILTDEEVDELAAAPVSAEQPPQRVAPTPPPPAQVPVQVAVPVPIKQVPVGATVTKVLKPRADGMGYDETTRVETKRPYPGNGAEGFIQQPAVSLGAQAQTQPRERSDDDRLFGGLAKRELSAAKYFEDCAQNKACAYWKVEVRRQSPVKWPSGPKGKALRQGDLGSIGLDTFPSMRERIIEQFGGGRYMLILKDDQNGGAHERMYINISTQEYVPKNPEAPVDEEAAPEEPSNGKAVAQVAAEEADKPEDRLTELRRRQQEKLAEAELKKVEAQIEKEERARAGEGNAELSSLREELRSSQEKMSELIMKVSEQSNETIKALAAKPQDGMLDKLLPVLATFFATSGAEKKEAEEARRREEERREVLRKEEIENRRREAEERRKEEAEERRREEDRREAQRKEEVENRRRDDERREVQRKEELENRRREDEKAETRRREEIQMLAKILEKKEDTTTPLMLKAIQESSQTFMQSMAEASKSTKGEIGETAKTQSQFLERIIGVLTETSRADSGKYEKLLDSLIANRLESGSREVENFRNAMELGKTQLREAMQLVEARDEEEEEPAAPAVDPNQSMWANLSNVILALILSKAGNKDIQQGVASALGQPGNAQLTMSDYQQVAQGMTPMVAQQMGFPQQSMPVAPMMLPQVAPVQQQPFIPPPPAPQMPAPINAQAAPVFVPPQMPQTPVPIPMPPGMQPMPMPVPQQEPAAQPEQTGPKQLPPAPKLDAAGMQRLREQVDGMIDMACADIADESREQEWTDYALGYLPKWFLDRMVMMIAAQRPDLVINLIRNASSVEKFTRLNALVMDATKYQIFMGGLLDIVSEHREDRAGEGFVMPVALPVIPVPAPTPDAPMPASAPPVSAIPIGSVMPIGGVTPTGTTSPVGTATPIGVAVPAGVVIPTPPPAQ